MDVFSSSYSRMDPINTKLLSAFLYSLGAFTPTIAAILASYRENGLREVRHLIYKTQIIPDRKLFLVLLISVLLKIVSFILVFIWVGETPVFSHLKNYSLLLSSLLCYQRVIPRGAGRGAGVERICITSAASKVFCSCFQSYSWGYLGVVAYTYFLH